MIGSGEYARLVGVSVWTIRRWAKSGYGPKPRTVGGRMRWDKSEIRRFFSLSAVPDRARAEWL